MEARTVTYAEAEQVLKQRPFGFTEDEWADQCAQALAYGSFRRGDVIYEVLEGSRECA